MTTASEDWALRRHLIWGIKRIYCCCFLFCFYVCRKCMMLLTPLGMTNPLQLQYELDCVARITKQSTLMTKQDGTHTYADIKSLTYQQIMMRRCSYFWLIPDYLCCHHVSPEREPFSQLQLPTHPLSAPRRRVPQWRTERFGKWRPFITAAYAHTPPVPTCAAFGDKARAPSPC